jgi:hypothetical protein
MKNTIRAHRNGGKKSVSPQAQTPTTPAPAAPVKHYALELIEWTEGSPFNTVTFNEVDISREDFDRLNENSIQTGDCAHGGQASFDKLLKIGLQAMLNAFPFCELENATNQSNALTMLLFQNLHYEQLQSGNFTSKGPEADSLAAGLQQLIWQTSQRLTKATNQGDVS